MCAFPCVYKFMLVLCAKDAMIKGQHKTIKTHELLLTLGIHFPLLVKKNMSRRRVQRHPSFSSFLLFLSIILLTPISAYYVFVPTRNLRNISVAVTTYWTKLKPYACTAGRPKNALCVRVRACLCICVCVRVAKKGGLWQPAGRQCSYLLHCPCHRDRPWCSPVAICMTHFLLTGRGFRCCACWPLRGWACKIF